MFSRVDDTIKEYRMVFTKLKEEVDRPRLQQDGLAGSSLENPIDLTEPDFPEGSTSQLPVELT